MTFDKLFEKLAALPVASVADDVALSVISGVVTTLTSPTGSGKTLIVPARLADLVDEQITVLVPRRFLAVNAAEIVAELTECEIGTDVGYAVGSQAGDRSHRSDDTKLVFATYGYALASGLINTATIFVLDEVHETSMDLSIVRALLYRRIEQGDPVRVLEMSATVDTRRQAAYWGTIANTEIFETTGETFPCDVRHRPAGRVEDEVMGLIEEGRRGILVFRPGKGEVEDTAKDIADLAQAAGLDIEVAQIYGEMGYAERREATADPVNGKVKVLVATNVAESGVSIPWLDAGASCGTGKENSVRPGTGATYLELVDLPRWRLAQQEGRVKRFCPGVFVLCSPIPYEGRRQASRPEIERLALTELVMHCAGFGLRTHELTFDYAPDPEKVEEAELKLQRLGLIGKNCKLTEAGKEIAGLPVGPETGAMLWHAHKTDCLPEMLPLAAVIEVGGLRQSFRDSHGLDFTSDLLDGLLAFQKSYFARGRERKNVLEDWNISYKRLDAAKDLLHDLERRLDVDASFNFTGLKSALCRAILAGSLDKIFVRAGVGYGGSEVASVKSRYMSYSVGDGSVLRWAYDFEFAAGDLRVITPKDPLKRPFTVLEKVTAFGLDDFRAVAAVRPEILTEVPVISGFGPSGTVNVMLFGEYLLKQSYGLPTDADSAENGHSNDDVEDSGMDFGLAHY